MISCDNNKKIAKNIQLCPNGCGKIIYTTDTDGFDLNTGKEHGCANSNSDCNLQPLKLSNSPSPDIQIDASVTCAVGFLFILGDGDRR